MSTAMQVQTQDPGSAGVLRSEPGGRAQRNASGTLTALEHARALRMRHGEEDHEKEPLVEQRSLAVYDRLIA